MIDTRISRVVYIVIRVRVEEHDYALLSAHRKWGDWSLVGGHVEPAEESDWARAAQREAEEELAPLRIGIDFAISPISGGPQAWGPLKSQSANGKTTLYEAAWFYLIFLREPMACIERLPLEGFLLVAEDLVCGSERSADVTALLPRLDAALAGGIKSVPYAWPHSVSASPRVAMRRPERPSPKDIPTP